MRIPHAGDTLVLTTALGGLTDENPGRRCEIPAGSHCTVLDTRVSPGPQGFQLDLQVDGFLPFTVDRLDALLGVAYPLEFVFSPSPPDL